MGDSETGSVFGCRRAGMLLHPTSLPGLGEHGVLGPEAYYFIDWLVTSGFTVWQMLPLGPVHDDGSPYQCLSAHAGNPALISLQYLKERGWLSVEDPRVDGMSDSTSAVRDGFLKWFADDGPTQDERFVHFVETHKSWLDDFALFMVIREQRHHKAWFQWPVALRDREALDELAEGF